MPLSLRPLLRRAARCSKRLCGEVDKQRHFSVSCLLVLLFLTVGTGFLISIALTWLIGLGKEVWDRFYGSGFCWLDMVANAAGIATGVLLALLM